jgi:hypothetical protein
MEPAPTEPDLTLLYCGPESPFRPLDWRWQVAGYFHRRGRRPGPTWADPWLLRAWHYLHALRRAGAPELIPPDQRDSALVAACALHSGAEPDRRLAVEARLLAGMSDAAIARRTGLPDEVIAAYEALFFDVRVRLDAPDHIAFRVIGPTLYDGSALDPALAVKHLSYHGGPIVADALLALVAASAPHAADPGDSPPINPGLACRLRLALAVKTAPHDPRTLLKLMRLDARMRELEHRAAADLVPAITGLHAWSPDTTAAARARGMARAAVQTLEESGASAPSHRARARPDPDSLLRATG